MANLTVRNLKSVTKQALRERAATNGRSMEEEVRITLDASVGGTVTAANAVISPVSENANANLSRANRALIGKTIILIISGGIAAYKSLDLIRRLKARGARVIPVMTRAAGEFITPLSVGAVAAETVFSDLFECAAEHDIGHIRLAPRRRFDRGGSGVGGSDGKNGQRACRRSSNRRIAGDPLAIAGGAGNEPGHVGPSGNTRQLVHAGEARGQILRTQYWRNGGSRRSRGRAHGRTGRNRRRRRRHVGADRRSKTACRQTGDRYFRANP